MRGMSKVAKPISIILVAIVIAAGAAIFLSREPAKVPENSEAATPLPAASVPAAGGGHIRGPEDAPLTLVEFGDYQCPSCKAFYPIINEVLKRYPKQVKLEFHHYPLVSIHGNSMGASMAAEAAGEQGRYWEMHDLLFDTQSQWAASQNADAEFLTLANRLGLNANKFMQDVRSPVLQQRVLEDVVRARDANLEGVPTIYLNGEMIAPGPTVGEFAMYIDSKLAATAAPVK
jgi:protein-disulfide isomerase